MGVIAANLSLITGTRSNREPVGTKILTLRGGIPADGPGAAGVPYPLEPKKRATSSSADSSARAFDVMKSR